MAAIEKLSEAISDIKEGFDHRFGHGDTL